MNVRIEGHTDNVTVADSKFANWDLSVGRSVAVMRYFTQSDLLPLDRMAAVGYGKTRPIAPNNDETTRALNRRVDFVLRLKSNLAKTNDNRQSDGVPL